MPKTPVKGLADEEIFVERAEHLRNRRIRDVAGDAEGGELTFRTEPTVPFHQGLGPGAGHGRPGVIEGTFPSQTGDGLIDVVRVELAACQSRSYLRFRQLAPREPS